MSNNIERVTTPSLPAAPTRVGQGTAIEASRAVAEVHAAILVARENPRSVQTAIAAMRQSCTQKALAERAFYRYNRGGKSVTGPTVHLARELARCWQNIQYGLVEMRRDDEYGQSEMQAWAWDVEANSRNSHTFIVPHKRTGDGPRLTDVRDIYENNANNGARRVREAILAILPPWFVEEAKDLCNKTLTDGGGKPLAQRVADAIRMYADMGITVDQLEQKLDRKSDRWTEHDVAQIGITYRSLQRGEVTRDEEFPPERVTGAEILAAAAAVPTAPVDAPVGDAGEDWPETATPGGTR